MAMRAIEKRIPDGKKLPEYEVRRNEGVYGAEKSKVVQGRSRAARLRAGICEILNSCWKRYRKATHEGGGDRTKETGVTLSPMHSIF